MTRVSGLYAITPEESDTEKLLLRVEAVLSGGCRLVQYRHKTAPPSVRVQQARLLARLCAQAGAALIVNDDPRLAVEAGAAGVHLGRDDGAVSAARALMPPEAVIGVSCYDDLDRAVRLRGEGADYVAFGSFFASTVKPGAVRPQVSMLAKARTRLDCPVVAIGGITIGRAPELVSAGAHALAVITDVFEAPDLAARAREYQSLFQVAPRSQPTLVPSS